MSEALAPAAAALAQRWGLPDSGPGPQGYRLVLDQRQLALHGPAGGPVYVDFVAGAVAHRRRFGGGRGQAIARAVGVKGDAPHVADATAGLGRDAFVLASLGCEVELLERSPVLAALLEDGLLRAAAHPEVGPIVSRMHLHRVDAEQWLARESVHVVYLDPMFPARAKSALVKKEMQALHVVVGGDPDADRLLPAARAAAERRVVVKRPGNAPFLADAVPHSQIRTRNHRFDIYLPIG